MVLFVQITHLCRPLKDLRPDRMGVKHFSVHMEKVLKTWPVPEDIRSAFDHSDQNVLCPLILRAGLLRYVQISGLSSVKVPPRSCVFYSLADLSGEPASYAFDATFRSW